MIVSSLDDLPRAHYQLVYADPPWHFKVYSMVESKARHPSKHYKTMTIEDICALPVDAVCAPDCVLVMWVTWPMLVQGLDVARAWGFTYKTCAFSWMKAKATQIELFDDEMTADMMLGYWTRANSEVAILATRGEPKRLDAGVRQGIIEPRRQHSRKPDCVYGRIERLVAGPYLELFARSDRPGWSSFGNQTGKFGVVESAV